MGVRGSSSYASGPRSIDHPTPRLRRVIAEACSTLADLRDPALRDLLTELILVLGHDQDTRVEMSATKATRLLETLRRFRECPS